MQIKIPDAALPKSGVSSSGGSNSGSKIPFVDATAPIVFVDVDIPSDPPVSSAQAHTDRTFDEDVFVDDDLSSAMLPNGQGFSNVAPLDVSSAPIEMLTDEQMDGMLSAYNKKKKQATWFIAGGVIGACIVGFISEAIGLPTGFVFLLAIAAIIAGIVILCKARKDYRIDDINEAVTLSAISSVFDEAHILRDIPDAKKDEIDECGLAHFYNSKSKTSYNCFYANDLVWGMHRGRPFEFADVHATYEWTDSDGDKHTTEIFTGQYLRFPTDKTMTCDLYIRRKARRERKKEKDGGIITDNPEFNEKWHVVSESPVDALYVLTPHFMETLERYETVISKSMGVEGKTDYIFRADGSFVAFVESNCNLFEMGNVMALDENGNKVKGLKAGISDMRAHYAAETQWMRDLMDTLRFD